MIFKDMKFEGQIDAKRTLVGYAASYGNIDHDKDIIVGGAFSKSIKEAFPKGRIKMLYQHYEPLGMPTVMSEDSKGLYVEGKISKTRLGDDVIELINDGVTDRMSVGFSLVKGKIEYDGDTRKILEGKLQEFSVVTFPANEQAAITGMKSLREMRDYMQRDDVNDSIKREMIEEIKELSALLGLPVEPHKSTQPPEQQPITKAAILAAINDTLGALALK
jgi:HK97 family phage prohead protease